MFVLLAQILRRINFHFGIWVIRALKPELQGKGSRASRGTQKHADVQPEANRQQEGKTLP